MSGAEAGINAGGLGHIFGFPEYAAAEQALLNTLQSHPEHLESYVDLCKLYFYSKRLPEAEQVARAGLIEAARQGGFEADWRQLHADGAGWQECSSPQRVYLYLLKALSFIRMRRLDVEGGEAILAHLSRLDPEDLVGASVVAQLATAVRDVRVL